MKKNFTDFLSFLEQYTTVVSVEEYSNGFKLDFKQQDQLKSIFFHNVIPNTTSDILNLDHFWIIWEDLWIHKQSIIKASIKAFFGSVETVHGRKTQVKSVTVPEAKSFLDHNHLFSASTGKFRLGLYHEKKLVALMTFSSGRNWKEKTGKSFEIIRFCNHRNVRVHGGFSKLLKAFILQKNPVQLMTYADMSWYKSSMYEQFGFVNKNQIKTNNFMVSNIHNQRKLKLSDNDIEQEWMKVVNYKTYKFTWESSCNTNQ